MIIRTYIRTLFNDLTKNNFLVKTFNQIVNFYCNQRFKKKFDIKFLENIPINNSERKNFSFKSVTGDKIDCK
jgi:hypothetical protein